MQERVFQKLFDKAKIARYSREEYAAYEESLKVYRDLKNSIDTAFEDGKAEGKVEGKAEGILEGEARKTFAIAKKMKNSKVPLDRIAEMTGLSP
ncbi:MAG: hypothetical protein JW795_20745, partial [Chitinivibrionales bacterium]|nr:hypothetical protein [Chitinivibrionales bacterium]